MNKNTSDPLRDLALLLLGCAVGHLTTALFAVVGLNLTPVAQLNIGIGEAILVVILLGIMVWANDA